MPFALFSTMVNATHQMYHKIVMMHWHWKWYPPKWREYWKLTFGSNLLVSIILFQCFPEWIWWDLRHRWPLGGSRPGRSSRGGAQPTNRRRRKNFRWSLRWSLGPEAGILTKTGELTNPPTWSLLFIFTLIRFLEQTHQSEFLIVLSYNSSSKWLVTFLKLKIIWGYLVFRGFLSMEQKNSS